MLLHNSHLAPFRSPLGPAKAGSVVRIAFLSDTATAIILRIWMGDERSFPMLQDGNTWTYALQVPEITGILWYDFLVYLPDGKTVRYGAPEDGLGGEGHVQADSVHSFQLTVYQPDFETPDFLHGATIYQIFPDRFCKAKTRSVDRRKDRVMQAWDEDLLVYPDPMCTENRTDNFYGGTLNGIREKLPYLHDLGVDVLYLNPIFEARSNHRYDTADYTRIDPMLGTASEFEQLCGEAEKLGMRILLDGVFSHTGNDSLYFNAYGTYPGKGACQGPDSPYYDWYTFEHFPDRYRCWWGFHSLPEIRESTPSFQRFILGPSGVVPSWLRRGASGWRLDVADELPMDFLRKLRKSAKDEKKDAVVLGEVWEDASKKMAYGEMRCYCTGDTLDSVMNYPLRNVILDFAACHATAYDVVRLILHQADVYPVPFRYALMNLLSSHDRPRALNVLVDRTGDGLSKPAMRDLRLTKEEYALARKRYCMCLDILCALPGCPTVYYGDEAGLTGPTDPFCRRPYPWGHEDLELRNYVRARLKHRQASEVLKRGKCEVRAIDDNTLRIRRFFDGEDAFGAPVISNAEEIFTIRRP